MNQREDDYQALPLIKVVGISAGGKSTLVKSLRELGYRARPVSQEHSNVATLWQQFDHPHLLIYLDVDLETQRQRRPDVTWNKEWLREEIERLDHARDHADLKIDTSGLIAEEVLHIAVTFLRKQQIDHADHPLPQLTATGSALQPTLPEDDYLPDPTNSDDKKLTRKERRKLRRAERNQSPAKST